MLVRGRTAPRAGPRSGSVSTRLLSGQPGQRVATRSAPGAAVVDALRPFGEGAARSDANLAAHFDRFAKAVGDPVGQSGLSGSAFGELDDVSEVVLVLIAGHHRLEAGDYREPFEGLRDLRAADEHPLHLDRVPHAPDQA